MIADVPHGLRQIRGRHKKHVYVVHREDISQVMHRRELFDEHHDHGLIVGMLHIIRHPKGLATSKHAAIAQRRILRRFHGLFSRLTGIDMRYHNAYGATVQGAHDDPGLVVVDARHRGHAPQVTGTRHVADLLPAQRPVLTLQPDAVKAKLPQKINHVGIGMP